MSIQGDIADVLRTTPGFLCSDCLATALGVSRHVAAMTTLGLARLDHFEMADAACSRCGQRRRVIRAISPPEA